MRFDAKRMTDDELQAAYLELTLELGRRNKGGDGSRDLRDGDVPESPEPESEETTREIKLNLPKPAKAHIQLVKRGMLESAVALYKYAHPSVSEDDAATLLEQFQE